MGLLLQGERVKRLRLAAHRLTERRPAQEQPAVAPRIPKPDWLLFFFDLCWLSGLLGLTLYISWVYDNLPISDPRLYRQYAEAFWNTPPLFHAFPKEYPPLSLIPFSFTLWPPSPAHYYWVFAMWMGLIVGISYIWVARVASRQKAIVYAIYLVVGGVGTLLMRFDLLPALATFGALLLAERKRYRWAYVLLAIGVLLKLYPAFLVPVLMAHQWRERSPAPLPLADGDEAEWTWRERLEAFWRSARESLGDYRQTARMVWQRHREMWIGVGLFTSLTLLGFAAPALVNFAGTISEFKYAMARPIQIESVPSSLLWLSTFLGFPAQANTSFGSLNLVGPFEVVIKPLSMLALVGGTLLVCWRVLRGKLTLGQGFVALIAVVLASNKMLSPQYLIWILPLLAYVQGFDLLWLAICVLTALIFPFLYMSRHPSILVPTNPIFLPTITLRNALLVTATVLAVLGQRGRAASVPEPEVAEAKTAELVLGGLERHELLAGHAPAPLEDQDTAQEGRKPLVKTSQEPR